MSINRKKPSIRFKGFTEDWEQRKLGELPEKTYGGGTPSTTNAEYWNGNIPWLQSSDITEGKLFDVTPKKFISQSGLNGSAAQIVPANSIAIITRVGVGKLAFLPFSYTTSQDFLSMSRLTTEPNFTVYACYKKLQSELNSVQGTSIKGITKDELLAKEIKVPSYEEQKQIGEYFRNLDRLITLHQRKCDKLVKFKKSMLEKMFPKNGEKFPEIRFNGFTEAWEQRKLCKVADFSKGQGYTKSDLRETGTPIILYGRLYTKYQSIIREVDTFADVISGAVLSKGGEVILPSSGETAEDIAIAASVEKSGVLLGGGLNVVVPHKEIESAFLAIEISYGTPHNELAKQAQGKSIVHLYNEDLKKVVVSYPSVEEQRKITSVFDNLDRLITLHQRKLEMLKKIKKSCLEKMFI